MSRQKLVEILLIPLVLLVVGGLVLPQVVGLLKASPQPSLRVDDVVVGTTHSRERVAEPRVEFALHNIGGRTSVLQRVAFTVAAVARVRTCYTEGDLSVAKTYGVKLPAAARVGQTMKTVPLRRQLRPDEAERLAFRFGLSGGRPGEVVAYNLTASLWHDEDRSPTRLGSLALVTPAFDVSDQLFTGSHAFDGGRLPPPGALIRIFGLGRNAIACLHDNTLGVDAVLARGGMRSKQLSAIGRWIYSPRAADAVAAKYGVG